MSVPRTPASGIAVICRDCPCNFSSFCDCLLFPHITFQVSELTIYTTSYYLHHLINTLSLLLPSLRTNWLTALHIFHGVSAAIQVSSTLRKNICPPNIYQRMHSLTEHILCNPVLNEDGSAGLNTAHHSDCISSESAPAALWRATHITDFKKWPAAFYPFGRGQEVPGV